MKPQLELMLAVIKNGIRFEKEYMEMIRRNNCNPFSKPQLGMTLLELLIVVAIIGILVAIAYPNYQQYVLKSHRSVAMTDLMRIQLQLEQNKTQTGNYDFQTVINHGRCTPILNCQSDQQRYQFSITSGAIDVNRYQLQATPVDGTGQTKDKCGTLILNSVGVGMAVKQGLTIRGCWNE